MVGIPTMEAQNYKMVVKKTDGTTQEIPVEDIMEITVDEMEPYLPLYVTVSENEMIDPSTASKSKSTPARSPIITTSTLNEFTMSQDGNKDMTYKLKKSSTGWYCDGIERWPITDRNVEVTFYAYNAGTFNFDYDINSRYIDFTVDHNPFYQVDLLVATKTTSYDACNGEVNLTFDHACAAVKFEISMTNKLSTKLGNNLIVTEVKLKNPIDQGHYEFNSLGSRWYDTKCLEREYTLTNTNDGIKITTEPKPLPCCDQGKYLFMIPQILDQNCTTELEITYTVGNTGDMKTVTIPINNNVYWKAGQKHTMSIKLNTSLIVTD